MTLCESDTWISELCRTIENRLRNVTILNKLKIPIIIHETFDNLPEAQTQKTITKTYAAYRCSTNEIYINCKLFQDLPLSIQEGALAHEIGHAVCHRDQLLVTTHKKYQLIGDEYLADHFACSWGFFEELKKERQVSYGASYVDALSKWENESEFYDAFTKWHNKKYSGF